MLTPDQIESKLDRILLKVQKPGRYVGGELNSVVKDWKEIRRKRALDLKAKGWKQCEIAEALGVTQGGCQPVGELQ